MLYILELFSWVYGLGTEYAQVKEKANNGNWLHHYPLSTSLRDHYNLPLNGGFPSRLKNILMWLITR